MCAFICRNVFVYAAPVKFDLKFLVNMKLNSYPDNIMPLKTSLKGSISNY